MKATSTTEPPPAEHLSSPSVVRERAFGVAALKTALVVGTALTLINHPEAIRVGPPLELLAPTLLNYLVPFLVAGYSRQRLLRRLRKNGSER